MNILIGADPEIFVKDVTNGQFICGEGLIPGSKEEPFRVPQGAIQVDGTALEFNIDPASTRVEFIGSVIRVFDHLSERVTSANSNLHLVAIPVADFTPDYFAKISPSAKKLGCEPDYNAWTNDINPTPDGERTFRTGSGHIHIGWTHDQEPGNPDHFLLCCNIAKQLDYYVGCPSLLWDTEQRRRILYGKAGAFRPKHYGLEYRVLSNAWLKSEQLIGYVYDAARAAIDAYARQDLAYERHGELAQTIINENQTNWYDRYGELTEYPLPTIEEHQ